METSHYIYYIFVLLFNYFFYTNYFIFIHFCCAENYTLKYTHKILLFSFNFSKNGSLKSSHTFVITQIMFSPLFYAKKSTLFSIYTRRIISYQIRWWKQTKVIIMIFCFFFITFGENKLMRL